MFFYVLNNIGFSASVLAFCGVGISVSTFMYQHFYSCHITKTTNNARVRFPSVGIKEYGRDHDEG
jgi:hypothetical protein